VFEDFGERFIAGKGSLYKPGADKFTIIIKMNILGGFLEHT